MKEDSRSICSGTFWLFPFPERSSVRIYIYRVATQCSLSSLELRVQFCLLVCCTYPSSSTVNKEKNLIDQRASLRVDTRETQQFYTAFTDLDLTWGSQGQWKQNLLVPFPGALFKYSGWNLICHWSNSGSTPWYCFWVTLNETREMSAVLLAASKNFKVGMLSDVYEFIWFKVSVVIDTIGLCSWMIVSLTLALIQGQRSKECEKAKTSMAIISQIFQLILMEFSMLLRLVGIVNLIVILSRLYNIQGREPCLCDFDKKNLPWLVFRHLPTNFFQTWYNDRNHLALHFIISLDDLDLQSKSQLYEKSSTSVYIFLESSLWIWIQSVSTTCSFVEAHAIFNLRK